MIDGLVRHSEVAVPNGDSYDAKTAASGRCLQVVNIGRSNGVGFSAAVDTRPSRIVLSLQAPLPRPSPGTNEILVLSS